MRNRVWLAFTGLVLLAAGGAVAAGGLGAFGRAYAARPLPDPRWIAAHRPFWPAVAAAASVVALLGFCWLTVQVRGRRLRRLAMGDAGSGTTRMAARVATRAITTDVTSYPGVRRVRTRLVGSGRRPRIRVNVTCDDDADLMELGERIRYDAMVRLRTTLDRQDIGGIVDFRVIRAEPVRDRRVW
jgi:hypothetical protein